MSWLVSMLLQISRPRFWMYLFGPVLVALAAAYSWWTFFPWLEMFRWPTRLFFLWLVLFVLYMLFPSNLLIYGVNDLSDEDTDRWNEKKWWYEFKYTSTYHHQVVSSILLINMVFVLLLVVPLWYSWESFGYSYQLSLMIALGCFVLFYFTSIFYSCKPIRAKSKPFIDWLFNILYILPGFALYYILSADTLIHWQYLVGSWLRCIAMHTFSAIPDIAADKKAWLSTTAVLLWKNYALVYCAWLRIGAASLLANDYLWFSILSALMYVLLVIFASGKNTFRVYTSFPWVNGIVGFCLFWLIILSQS